MKTSDRVFLAQRLVTVLKRTEIEVKLKIRIVH